ncbi:MAG: hypothetical protein RBG13Loki_1470 [Promethearchaeota archaeon CR_4]|nr:MAG: hypothetical protein RBG13Loki_1470 [Candidatus Lokiarchaeota archaeon CR_4]
MNDLSQSKLKSIDGEDKYDVLSIYLETLEHSSSSQASNRYILKEFFEVVQKESEKVTIHDWDRYAAYLNSRISHKSGKSLTISSKETYHGCIRGFYKFATPRFMREGKQFMNPIPDFKYSGLTKTIIRKGKENKLLSRDQMKKILDAARGKGYDKYLIFLIKKHTGMRNGEALSIRIEDVHLEERWIGTCLEDGARKSNKNGEKPLPFFIPKFLADELRLYIMRLQSLNPGNPWLFPGRDDRFYRRDSFLCVIRRLRSTSGVYFKGHWFRHTLNTYRKYEKQCPREIRKQLINHKTSESIDAYDEGNMKMRRDDYDKYHPYSEL